jgi:hypothetical protein
MSGVDRGLRGTRVLHALVAVSAAAVLALVPTSSASARVFSPEELQQTADHLADKYFPLMPEKLGGSSADPSTTGGERSVERDLPSPPPAWIPEGFDASNAASTGQILPMGYGTKPGPHVPAMPGTPAAKNSLLGGLPVPLNLGYAIGQHNNNGQYEAVQCGVEEFTDTPYARDMNFRDITFGLGIQCNSPNVSGYGHANLGRCFAPTECRELKIGSTYYFSGTGAHYRYETYSRGDNELQQVYGFFRLTIAGDESRGDGWLATPPGARTNPASAVKCEILSNDIICVVVSQPFAFAPDAPQNCDPHSGGNFGVCQAANNTLSQAQGIVSGAQQTLANARQSALSTAYATVDAAAGAGRPVDDATAVLDWQLAAGGDAIDFVALDQSSCAGSSVTEFTAGVNSADGAANNAVNCLRGPRRGLTSYIYMQKFPPEQSGVIKVGNYNRKQGHIMDVRKCGGVFGDNCFSEMYYTTKGQRKFPCCDYRYGGPGPGKKGALSHPTVAARPNCTGYHTSNDMTYSCYYYYSRLR